jgi:hypothetical protein
MDDHGHSHEEVVVVTETEEIQPAVEVYQQDHSGHNHEGLDGLWEVMFGFEHVVAEVFWNTVWLGAAFAIGRLIAFRKVHKYIDDKHGVKHNKSEY